MIVYEVLYYKNHFTPDTPYREMSQFFSGYTGPFPLSCSETELIFANSNLKVDIVEMAIFLCNPILETEQEQLISQIKYGHPYGSGPGLIKVIKETYTDKNKANILQYLKSFMDHKSQKYASLFMK